MTVNAGVGRSAINQSLNRIIPQVSIIIPAYNAAETIEATLESVLAQTYNNWEAIIVDDGSTDKTATIATKFSNRDPRIRMIQKQQGGEASARNAGIGEARYEWLLFLDADDWISPIHLQIMTQQIIANPQLDAVHCRSARVSADGTTIVENYQPPSGDLFPILARRAVFPVHACIIRKSIVDAVGGFDTSLIKSPDWDLWQRVARTGAHFGSVQDVLSFYRMRPNAASLDAYQMLRDGLRVIRQGHSPDPRVQNPHPDHANGQPPDEIQKQEFYLLCWCAGLLLGSGKDARPLLELLKDEHYSDLYPDAVAQCIFDSAPLPTCKPPESWEELGAQILTAIDEFLVALEKQSKTPDLALLAGASLRRMILAQSPNWSPLISHFEKRLVELRSQIDADRKVKEVIIEDQIGVIRKQDQTLIDRDQTIAELREQMERDRKERVGIIEEQSRVLQQESQTLAQRDKTVEELYARIERERIERVTIIDEQTQVIQDLNKTLAQRDSELAELHLHKSELETVHHEHARTLQEANEQIDSLEQERSHWQTLAEERESVIAQRESVIAELHKKWWIRVALKLTKPKQATTNNVGLIPEKTFPEQSVPKKTTKTAQSKKLLLRAYAVSSIVILTSILQAAHFTLDGPWKTSSMIAVGLAVLNAIMAVLYLISSGTLFLPVVSVLYLAQFTFFLVNFFSNASSASPRLLQVALVLVYAATVLTFLLGAPKIISRYKAAAISFALALAIFICEMLIPSTSHAIPAPSKGPNWSGKMDAHPVLGEVYRPHSTMRTYYPDNRRNYFHVMSGNLQRWWLRTEKGSNAEISALPQNSDAVRVVINKMATSIESDIQLNLPHLKVQQKHAYLVTFRARADRPRSIIVGFARAHEPWDGLGLYEKVDLTTVWKQFQKQFVSSGDDDNARIHFDLGGSDAATEFAAVEAQTLPDKHSIAPNSTPNQYFVEYRFNDVGCRGPDRSIPKPSGNQRILLLGDSFTLGVGVHEEDTFAARLEKMLKEKTSSSARSTEVINCGVSGFDVKKSRLFYDLFASQYQPDLVLLTITPSNVISSSADSSISNPGRIEELFRSPEVVEKYLQNRPNENISSTLDEVALLNKTVKAHGSRLAVMLSIDKSNGQYIDPLQKAGIPALDLGARLYAKHSKNELIVDPQVDNDLNQIAHAVAAQESFEFVQRSDLRKAN